MDHPPLSCHCRPQDGPICRPERLSEVSIGGYDRCHVLGETQKMGVMQAMKTEAKIYSLSANVQYNPPWEHCGFPHFFGLVRLW